MDRFAALAEPNRRRMLELIARGPLPSGAIAGEFDLTPAAVSQHLKTLREAGLVRVTVDGQRRIVSDAPLVVPIEDLIPPGSARDEVETELRAGWDRYEYRKDNTSTWDDIKAAVRDAWDRARGRG